MTHGLEPVYNPDNEDAPEVETLDCESCGLKLDADDAIKVFGGWLCHECYTASGIDYDGDEESED